jgi:hypothetical protein
MPNRRRGEVALELGGQRYILCLTLAALTDAEVASLPIEGGLEPLAGALADLLVATFGAAPQNPPAPQDA